MAVVPRQGEHRPELAPDIPHQRPFAFVVRREQDVLLPVAVVVEDRRFALGVREDAEIEAGGRGDIVRDGVRGQGGRAGERWHVELARAGQGKKAGHRDAASSRSVGARQEGVGSRELPALTVDRGARSWLLSIRA
jgi:hypothetical protein